jgi:hypothetical protein
MWMTGTSPVMTTVEIEDYSSQILAPRSGRCARLSLSSVMAALVAAIYDLKPDLCGWQRMAAAFSLITRRFIR